MGQRSGKGRKNGEEEEEDAGRSPGVATGACMGEQYPQPVFNPERGRCGREWGGYGRAGQRDGARACARQMLSVHFQNKELRIPKINN